MVKSQSLGYPTYFNTDENKDDWYFVHSDEKVKDVFNETHCKCCGKLPIAGNDACVCNLITPNIRSWCCGHNIEKPYVVLQNGIRITFQDKKEMIEFLTKDNNK